MAITVSTSYSDLLEICIKANQGWFDKWIVITQQFDFSTREVLEKHPNVDVLYWNPYKHGASFDKGTAVRTGQKFAYQRYPGAWYLLLDSDIVLEGHPELLRDLLPGLSPAALYGAERWDYSSLADFEAKSRGERYLQSNELHGYFQLYAKPFLYTRSLDASVCDLKFRALFRNREVLYRLSCSHLGKESNWQGRPSNPNDFLH